MSPTPRDTGSRDPRLPHETLTLRPGLTASDLADVATIEALWQTATTAGLLPATAYWRETFYGLCHSIWRHREKLANPVGLLHYKLRSGQMAILSHVDDAHDRAWAREQLVWQTKIAEPHAVFVQLDDAHWYGLADHTIHLFRSLALAEEWMVGRLIHAGEFERDSEGRLRNHDGEIVTPQEALEGFQSSLNPSGYFHAYRVVKH